MTTEPGSTPYTIRVDDRLECSTCHEVALWCQCDPSPFSDADHEAIGKAFRRWKETGIISNEH